MYFNHLVIAKPKPSIIEHLRSQPAINCFLDLLLSSVFTVGIFPTLFVPEAGPNILADDYESDEN
jgi:hypothetical protein